MKIGFVRVFVSDFNESLRFYTQTLGMKLDYTDNAHWAQFVSGEDVSLAIEKCDPDHMEQGSKLVGRFVGVTMMVDDINAEYARLTAKGVKFSGEPEKQSFGGTLAHLHDLDGNVLTLMQEGEPSPNTRIDQEFRHFSISLSTLLTGASPSSKTANTSSDTELQLRARRVREADRVQVRTWVRMN